VVKTILALACLLFFLAGAAAQAQQPAAQPGSLSTDFLARYFGACILDEVKWYEKEFGGLTPRQKDSYIDMGAWLLEDVGRLSEEWGRLQPFGQKVRISRACFGLDISPQQAQSHLEHLLKLGVGAVRLTAGYGGIEAVEAALPILEAAQIEPLVKLVQPSDRVTDLTPWEAFLREAFARLAPRVRYFEIGTCPNRIKWSGYEAFYDYAEAAKVARKVADAWASARTSELGGVSLLGPATQDFESYWTATVLRPFDMFDILSDHLYVDRSGQPENAEEGIFDVVGKARMFKAIGRLHGIEQFWSTQFNWVSTDTPEGVRYGGGVSLEDQANYLTRYYLLALASGMADRCYWFVLEATLCGLLDAQGRQRPAYHAYAFLADTLSGATFERRWPTPNDVYVLEFSKRGECFLAAWTVDGGSYALAVQASHIRSRDGQPMAAAGDKVSLGPSPLYLTLRPSER